MITVLDTGRPCQFTFDSILQFHGPAAPGGVAHAVKLMELVFPRLSPLAPLERRELEIRTSFGGPGFRDAIEMVTRAVSDRRFTLDETAADGLAVEGYRRKYVYRLNYRDAALVAVIREDIVRDEFLELAAKGAHARSKDEDMQLAWLKEEMAARVMKLHASAVFDIVEGS